MGGRTRKVTSAILIILAMLVLAACGGGSGAGQNGSESGQQDSGGSQSSTLVKARLVFNSNTSNLVSFLAADQNLYEKYGVDAEIIVAGSGAESNELLASGRADGGTLGLGPSVVAWSNGINLVPVVKYRDGADVYSILAHKDAGIQTIADLKGKRVAVAKGTDPETAFILALKAHGVEYSELEVLDVKWADQPALLDRGEVDAVNSNEPFTTTMLNTMSDKVMMIERLTPYYGNGGLMLLTEDFVSKHPEAAKGITLAFWEGHKIVREQPELAIETLKKWLNLDDDTAQSTLQYFGARPQLTDVTIRDLGINVDLLLEQGKIRSTPDVEKHMEPGLRLQDELMQNPEYKALLP